MQYQLCSNPFSLSWVDATVPTEWAVSQSRGTGQEKEVRAVAGVHASTPGSTGDQEGALGWEGCGQGFAWRVCGGFQGSRLYKAGMTRVRWCNTGVNEGQSPPTPLPVLLEVTFTF